MGGNFRELFTVEKPIIGMIHLAGADSSEIFERALEELEIYGAEGVNGAIIENYRGCVGDIENVLEHTSRNNPGIVIGVNVLGVRNSYPAFNFASAHGAKFVQVDSVQTSDLSNLYAYNQNRFAHRDIQVLGGVRFKGTRETGNPLELDLRVGISRCEAIVTTGSGTGVETPIEKLEEFRIYLGGFPLIVGAGVNAGNAYEQLRVADGAIVGSDFKPERDIDLPVNRERVRRLMDVVNEARDAYAGQLA